MARSSDNAMDSFDPDKLVADLIIVLRLQTDLGEDCVILSTDTTLMSAQIISLSSSEEMEQVKLRIRRENI